MKVLVVCEFSGRIRDAFAKKGHDAWSCDLRGSLTPGQHKVCDAETMVKSGKWDLLVAHPPCTHLTVAGSRFFKKLEKRILQCEALRFFKSFLDADVPMICVENPVGIASTRICKPSQIVQPYWFGDPQQKTTCLWLKGLPCLKPTNMVKPRMVRAKSGRILAEWLYATDRNRGMFDVDVRSITPQGMADAMADQWG